MQKKIFGVLLAVAFVFSGVVSPVNAATVEELQAMIAQLQAQIAGLGGSSSSGSSYNFTRDLTIGSTGADVVALQDILISQGYLTIPAGTSKGYFGPLTQSALAKWQASVGISPASGYFGPITRAKVNSMGGTSGDNMMDDDSDDSDDSDDLSGGEASIEDFDAKSGNDSEVEEGDSAEVMDFEFDVEDGDARVERIDISFQQDSSSEEQDPWKVFDNVALLLNGDEIADMDTDDEDAWSDEEDELDSANNVDDYSIRFTGLDEIIREGETAEFTVVVTAADGIDDLPASNWKIGIGDDGIRVIDGEGIDSYIGDDTDVVTFDVEEAGTDEELNVRESDDDPDSTTLVLEDDTTSDWFTIFEFELEAEENDIEVTELPVTIALSSSTYNNIVDDVELVIDGQTYDDYTVASGTLASTTITFDLDDEDVVIDEDSTVAVELRVKFKALVVGNEGMTVYGEVTSTNVGAIDAEGADDLGIGQLNGSALGETHYLRTDGIQITEEGSSSASSVLNLDTTAGDDQGKYVLQFRVTALEETAYISLTATSTDGVSTTGAEFQIEDTTNTVISSGTKTSELRHVSGGSRTGNFVRINDGDSAVFELTVYFDSAGASSTNARLQLEEVFFNTSASTSGSTGQIASPEEDFETPAVQVLN